MSNGLNLLQGWHSDQPGHEAQSVTRLTAADTCLSADPGVVSLIPARSHTRVGSHVVLLGYTVRMFEYTVQTFWSNVSRFLSVYSSVPRKLYTIFQPTFSPIKTVPGYPLKLLTLSTNSVTKKIIVVPTAYFYRVRTGLKSTWIYRTVLKSPWKFNLPWKVLENTWKVLEFYHLQEDSTLSLET